LNGTNGHHTIGNRFDDGTETGSNSGESKPDKSQVYIISSKDSAVTQAMNMRLAAHIRESTKIGSELLPSDLAYTLAERRSRFPWATAVRARSLAELANRLGEPERKVSRAMRNPRLGFVFTGQGAQWHAMGRELTGAYPVFGAAIRRADQILKEYGAIWSLEGR